MATTKTVAHSPEGLLVKYEPVIGLEVHVQLLTRSKIFCGCSTKFGAPPNSNTCPVCLGLPGALPVLNRDAVAMAVKAALALNCRINRKSIFARKNYFYPDLPKGYQISQYDQPLAEHGWIVIHTGGPDHKEEKKIGITRLHMEEDAGKSIHDGFLDSDRKTYVDLNRSGVPLSEIVSEPDLRSPEEAYDYLTRLKQALLYLGVSDCNMEEGSLRCDANVSVRPRGQKELGVKTEVKNLNSFRFLQRALEYEIARQIQVLEEGGKISQETRLWNSNQGRTEAMRSKEQAHDYRYFPEPDLLPLIVSEAWQEEIRKTIPELPEAKRHRFMTLYGLSEYDADVLTQTQELASYYERVAAKAPDAKIAANWVMVELLGALNAAGKDIAEPPISADNLAELLQFLLPDEERDKLERRFKELDDKLVGNPPQPLGLQSAGAFPIELFEEKEKIEKKLRRSLSGKLAKVAFQEMFKTSETAEQVLVRLGLKQISDPEEIRRVVQHVVAANPKQLEQYRAGKTTLFGFFVGQVMKETKGQANPQKVNELLKAELEKS